MKPSQRQSYAERIDRVVARLETADPESIPAVPELAAIAALSEFHFQRIFRLMTGESVGEAVRRVRLARSVPEIAAAAPIIQAGSERLCEFARLCPRASAAGGDFGVRGAGRSGQAG